MMGRYQFEHGNRPRLLLAYADAAYASQCGRYFRRLGWEVQMVASGLDARELAHEFRPDVVVLDENLLDQSGWLTSAKISMEKPNRRIILVANRTAEDLNHRRDMVGAEQVVCREDGAEALAEAILGQPNLLKAI